MRANFLVKEIDVEWALERFSADPRLDEDTETIRTDCGREIEVRVAELCDH